MNSSVALVPPSPPVQGTPTQQIVYITPEIAQSLLERNEMNRNLKPQHVSTYAQQMKEGKFLSLNGQTISISGTLTTGRLIDGQHRLHAIIESQVTLPFIVVTNLSDDVISTIDIGAKRSVGDLFDMNGIVHGRGLSACISTYTRLDARNDTSKAKNVHGGLVEFKQTPDSIFRLYNTMKNDADEIINISRNYWDKFRVMGPSQVGAMMLYTRLHSQFKDRAENEFWKPLFTGEGATGMVLVCRNVLISELGLQKHKRSKPSDLINIVIKAYNIHFQTPTKIIKATALMNTKIDKNFIFV
jgi:hypothetical protein